MNAHRAGDEHRADEHRADERVDPLRPGDRVDWRFAATVGARLVPAGPTMTEYTRRQVREELAECARAAEGPVWETTRLADGLRVPSARIVDRPAWIRCATTSVAAMLGSPPDSAGEARPGDTGLLAKTSGAQTGAVLAFLATAILGQYDPFSPDPETGENGVLLLVAPNIVHIERALRLVPRDFRMWVCLHEVTHRVQFSANPWLAGYMTAQVDALSVDAGESIAELVTRIRQGMTRPRERGVVGLMQMLQTPEQYEAMQRLLMLGTLLEGHADHVMDAVGPDVVPTVATIRAAFDKRRKSPKSPLARIVRAAIGMDAKAAQYVRGKAFVDEVVATVGTERFNSVWTGPETLPLPDEIGEPRRWIDRVL